MESEKAKSLAHAVRALADTQAEYALVKQDFKDRTMRLEQVISKLSRDILTGQGDLPLETTDSGKETPL